MWGLAAWGIWTLVYSLFYGSGYDRGFQEGYDKAKKQYEDLLRKTHGEQV